MIVRRFFLRLLAAVRVGAVSLSRYPLRTALTAGGILVGVLLVTVVITIGDGAERSIGAELKSMGENLFTILPRDTTASGVGRQDQVSLDEHDGMAIASDVPDVSRVAPVIDGVSRAVFYERNTSAQVVGTTLPYFSARNLELASGTLWDVQQEHAAARVALIGATVQKELFLGADPVGQSIRLGQHAFIVLGVLEPKGQTRFGGDQDNVVIVPLRTMRAKVTASRPFEVKQLLVKLDPAADGTAASRAITLLLRQRHHLGADQEDDFWIRDSGRFAQAQRAILSVVRALLLSIAGISLFIGGIGVMNIMLVSVTERSREIGTRLAIGAQAHDILLQFLTEATLLCLFGGIGGALVSLALLSPLEAYFGWQLELSLNALVVALAVSTGVGLIFGLIPARRAARLDPVEALRRD